MLRSLTCLGLGALALLSVAQADVYRWLDERGEVHYSDRWVPGSQLIKSARPRSIEDDSPRSADNRSAADSRTLAAGARASDQTADQANSRAMQQDKAKIREQQCKEARERYDKAIIARRIYKPSKDGQDREYLSDDEADAYRADARNAVQAFCGSVPPPAP